MGKNTSNLPFPKHTHVRAIDNSTFLHSGCIYRIMCSCADGNIVSVAHKNPNYHGQCMRAEHFTSL